MFAFVNGRLAWLISRATRAMTFRQTPRNGLSGWLSGTSHVRGCGPVVTRQSYNSPSWGSVRLARTMRACTPPFVGPPRRACSSRPEVSRSMTTSDDDWTAATSCRSAGLSKTHEIGPQGVSLLLSLITAPF